MSDGSIERIQPRMRILPAGSKPAVPERRPGKRRPGEDPEAREEGEPEDEGPAPTPGDDEPGSHLDVTG